MWHKRNALTGMHAGFGGALTMLSALFALPASLHAYSQPNDPGHDAGKGIDVSVMTVEQNLVRGRLEHFSIRGGAALRTTASDPRSIPAEDIVWIRRMDAGPSDAVSAASLGSHRDVMIRLKTGDVLSGRILEHNGDQSDPEKEGADSMFWLETTDLGTVGVSLDQVSRIDTNRANDPAYQRSVRWFDRLPTTDDDRVLLVNGDVLVGFILHVSRRGLIIETSMGETKVAFQLLVSATFASTPTQPSSVTVKHPHVRATFRESGRVLLDDIDWTASEARATAAFGQTLRFDADRITNLEVIGGRWEWLSGHQPISSSQTPMLSLPWEVHADHNVLGGAISVGGTTYEHGIGVHSRSILTYDLRGAYSAFVTSYGLDDDSGPFADVSVRILVDGQPQYEKSNIIAGVLHGPVRINVTNANRIELVVDFGANGDLQDRFNWVEPALIR